MENGTQIIDLGKAHAAAEPPAKRTLMQIVDDYMAELQNSDGEVTLELGELEAEIDDKALAYKRVAELLRGKAKAQAAEALHHEELAKKFSKRENAIDAEIERLKTRLGEAMDLVKKPHIQTVYGKIYFRATKSAKLVEGWASKVAAQWPQYVKTTHEAKKSLLMADYTEAYKKAYDAAIEHLLPIMTEAEAKAEAAAKAKAEALKQLPEGFTVDEKRGLYGI